MIPLEGESNASTQRISGSSSCAASAVSHCRSVTPFAFACASRRSSASRCDSLVATISLPQRLCSTPCSAQLLYRYCAEHGGEHRRCGKLIVATSESQRDALDRLLAQAKANGVTDLQWLTAEAAHELEPEIRCVDALLSPSSGIIDSHAYMLSLLGAAEALGAA